MRDKQTSALWFSREILGSVKGVVPQRDGEERPENSVSRSLGGIITGITREFHLSSVIQSADTPYGRIGGSINLLDWIRGEL